MQNTDLILRIRDYLVVTGPMSVEGLYSIFGEGKLSFADFHEIILSACKECRYIQTDSITRSFSAFGQSISIKNIHHVG